jgi:cell division protein FtsI (penicillin-binding protein 3)
LVTLAAAFDQNLIRAEEVFDCENGAVRVAGHLIHDHKKYGMLTVADILANSSDVGAIKIALRLGSSKFYDYIRAFGFGAPTGVDLPGESRGLLRRLDHWGSFSSLLFLWDGKSADAAPDDHCGFPVANGGYLQTARGPRNAPWRPDFAFDGPSARKILMRYSTANRGHFAT